MTQYSLPSDAVQMSFSGIPTGLVSDLGGQVRRSNDTIVVGRTTDGFSEVPAGSGNYLFGFVAPAEMGDYVVTVDWSAGVLEPATSLSEDLQVTITLPVVASGLGPIADAAAAHMGNIFQGLKTSPRYGAAFITTRVEVVKRRILKTVPVLADEDTLDMLVVDYLGKLVSLELMPAAFDWLLDQPQSISRGNEPAESTTYVDRIKVLEQVRDLLLEQTRRDEAIVLPLIPDPILRESAGPAISEADDCRVTDDPRDFPPYDQFPTRTKERVW